jgi:ABC-type multidrug transport system permease subunit
LCRAVPTERKILLQQTREGLYSTSSSYLAKLLAEVPVFALTTGVFAVLFYFLVNLRDSVGSFFIFLLILFLVFNAAFAFGVIVITLLPDPAAALQLFPIVVVPLMMFSGYFLNSENTPVYLVWIEHMIFLKYGLRASFNNEFAGTTFFCQASELVNTTIGAICPTTNGDNLLRFYGFNRVPIYADLIVLGGFIAVQHMICMLLLRRSASKSTG